MNRLRLILLAMDVVLFFPSPAVIPANAETYKAWILAGAQLNDLEAELRGIVPSVRKIII